MGYQFSKRKANLVNPVPSDFISGMVTLLTLMGMGGKRLNDVKLWKVPFSCLSQIIYVNKSNIHQSPYCARYCVKRFGSV